MFLGALGIAFYAFGYFNISPGNHPFEEQMEVYKTLQLPLLTHITGGAIALVLGPLQFIPILRRRATGIHRMIGAVYVLAVLASATGGFVIAQTAYGGASVTAGFSTLAVLWSGATLTALYKALRGDFASHRRWMIRSYAMTFAAFTLRAQLGLLQGPAALSFEEAYLITAWVSWGLNLLIVEWFVLKK